MKYTVFSLKTNNALTEARQLISIIPNTTFVFMIRRKVEELSSQIRRKLRTNWKYNLMKSEEQSTVIIIPFR